MLTIQQTLQQVIEILNAEKRKFALVGGLAIAFRAVSRMTTDIDLAIAIDSDTEAESVVRAFTSRGYIVRMLLEQKKHKRIATVRLQLDDGPMVDLLFASSGVEQEIVHTSERIKILPKLACPVVNSSYLLATKILSQNNTSRIKDQFDIRELLKYMRTQELSETKNILKLITKRKFNRDKNLLKELNFFVKKQKRV